MENSLEKKSKRKRISVPGTGPVATSNVKKISSGMIVANELKSEENQSSTEGVVEGAVEQNANEVAREIDTQVSVSTEQPVQMEKVEKEVKKP